MKSIRRSFSDNPSDPFLLAIAIIGLALYGTLVAGLATGFSLVLKIMLASLATVSLVLSVLFNIPQLRTGTRSQRYNSANTTINLAVLAGTLLPWYWYRKVRSKHRSR